MKRRLVNVKSWIVLIICCLNLSGISYANNKLTAKCVRQLSGLFKTRVPIESIREHSVRKDEEFLRLLSVVYGVESGYQVDAVSPAGALGIGQLLPSTAREAARELGDPVPSNSDLFKLSTNIRLSSHYLRKMLTTFGENVILGLVAYNAGSKWASRVRKRNRVPNETAHYIVSITYLTQEFCK